MKLARVSWLVVLFIIALTAAVPVLRGQFVLGLRFAIPSLRAVDEYDSAVTEWIKPYQDQPRAFVEQRYPDDPQMLLGAAILAEDTDLFKRAAETANTPVAWAAYVERLMQTAPSFERIASSGVDPADSAAIAEEQKRIAESGYPDRLTPEQADPILSALRRWQEADPDNALPVALEMRMLYGLHQDRDALSTWARAARMPVVTSYPAARAEVVRSLFVARGMPEPEALLTSQMLLILPSYARLRDAARIAAYEGRLAAMRDDPTTAITWWQSTADLGLHMQDSPDTIIGMLVGVAIQGIGASPVWRWTPSDDRNGVPTGPLLGGRYFWGDHHDLYLAHMGEAKDKALLDSLVRGKLRSKASRDYTSDSLGMFGAYFVAASYLSLAAAAAGVAVLFALLYLIFGTWSRRAADSATNIHPLWQIVLAGLLIAPIAFAALPVLDFRPWEAGADAASAMPQIVWLAAFALLLLLAPPLAALRTRAPAALFRTAWRGNLRRIFPVAIALCALLFLGLNVYAASVRSAWYEQWSAPGATEMTDMVQTLGDSWTNPTVPPDAYRAQYPPEVPR